MRDTVPEGGLFGKSLADDVFRSMLDERIARAAAEKSPFGLADAVVRSLKAGVKPAGDSSEAAGDGGAGAPAGPRPVAPAGAPGAPPRFRGIA
jgi:Rod binding domain-containing protein